MGTKAKLKYVTFTLPVELIEKYKKYAKENYIPSVSAGVREALEEYAEKIERDCFTKEMIRAAHDPLFLQDIKENMRAFEASDIEATDDETREKRNDGISMGHILG
ncbi:MAG: ribbon-helix-helix domain-containing protein [Eubacteriales bacterium]|jgi:predicted DNA-binding protein|nr:ribbon-helix-helix domain-containing protein [Eubacteriales bacterium]